MNINAPHECEWETREDPDICGTLALAKLLYEKCLSHKELMQEILEDYVFLREKASNDLEQLRTNLQEY